MASVHPSRQNLVPTNHNNRPSASDSYDPPARTNDSSSARRQSPSYESYDRVRARRDDEEAREDESRRRARDDLRRERESRDDERERRGIERETRRATPERELGRGGGGGGYQGGGYQGRGGGGGGGRGGGEDWFESRRKERDNSAVSIWPASPKAPERSNSPSRKKSSKSSKHKSSKSRSRRRDSTSDSSSDSSSDSDSEADKRKSKKHRSSKSSSSKHKKKHHESSSSRKRSRVEGDEELEVESAVARIEVPENEEEDESMWVEKESAIVADDDDDVGPLPLNIAGAKGNKSGGYGGALRPGEGSAMAAYVADGERIPRRGEIGMTSNQIEAFEVTGYVMSGSRHQRMNAVRVRKENQVISAEEKRGILKMQAEEKAKRENQIVASFKELVSTKLAAQ